ncbi:MAG: 50S ribosomal protein L29 [Candidatus Bathyarchaeota archaeon]|jgi:large subunit ribosomal protein L29|nr:50S ribosomal protein L29 [Candidatus Bathyarchaeota archaeon]
MPAVRLKDIREMSSEQRRKRAVELQTELVRLRTMVKAGGSIENTGRVRELRKAIARILTVEKESQPRSLSEEKKR